MKLARVVFNTIFIIGAFESLYLLKYTVPPVQWLFESVLHVPVRPVSFVDTSIYYKIAFLLHTTCPVFYWLLGPLILAGFRNDWRTKDFLIKAYLISALLPLLMPIMFFMNKPTLGPVVFQLLITMEFIGFFTLYKMYTFYIHHNPQRALVYLIYHYCILLGSTQFGRILSVVIYLALGDKEFLNVYGPEVLYASLVVGIICAKIVGYGDPPTVYKDDLISER